LAQEEDRFVAGKLPDAVYSAWIGLTDNEAYGGGEAGDDLPSARTAGLNGTPGDGIGWKWTSGEVFDFQYWRDNEPSGGSREDGVSTTTVAGWGDRPADDQRIGGRLPYVVEYEVNSPTNFAVPSPQASELPGPQGGLGNFGVREVSGNGTFDGLYGAMASLTNVKDGAVVVDYTSDVIDFSDGGGNRTRLGQQRSFGVVDEGLVKSNEVEYLALSAHGRIRVEEGQAGPWTFRVESDDGFELWIKGARFSSVHGPLWPNRITDYGSLTYTGGRSTDETLGVIDLAPGDYELELIYHEAWGVADIDLSAAPGVHTKFDSSFSLIGAPAIEVHGVTPRISDQFKIDLVTRVGGAQEPLGSIDQALALLAQPDADDIVRTVLADTFDLGYRGLFGGSQSPTDPGTALRAVTNLIVDQAGIYTFGFESSDGARLSIQNARFLSAGGAATMVDDGQSLDSDHSTGNGRSWGSVELQPGEYAIELVAFNTSDLEGYAQLYVAPGEMPFLDRDGFRLLGTRARRVDLSRAAGLQLVPEPSTKLLAVLGLAAFAAFRFSRSA